MGKLLLKPEEIVSNNVNTYLKNATSDYTKFLNDAPTFVTYYSKNLFNSTFDSGFENINQTVGGESPIRYNKVENLPLYKVETASFDTTKTEFGITGEIQSSAIIIPDTVEPETDDHFIIHYQNDAKIFIITDVNTDNINNKKYYKINFRLSDHTKDQIDLQVAKELAVDYDLIGEKKNVVFDKIYYAAKGDLENVFDRLVDFYRTHFFDDYNHVFVTSNGIDALLNKFIHKNELTKKFNAYRSYKYIDTELFDSLSYNELDGTIFSLVLDKEIKEDFIYKDNLFAIKFDKVPYSYSWLKNVVAPYVKHVYPDFVSEDPFNKPHPLPIIEYVKDVEYTQDDYINIIRDYINGVYDGDPNKLLDASNYIELNEISIYTIPLVLFIIKTTINAIENKSF